MGAANYRSICPHIKIPLPLEHHRGSERDKVKRQVKINGVPSGEQKKEGRKERKKEEKERKMRTKKCQHRNGTAKTSPGLHSARSIHAVTGFVPLDFLIAPSDERLPMDYEIALTMALRTTECIQKNAKQNTRAFELQAK